MNRNETGNQQKHSGIILSECHVLGYVIAFDMIFIKSEAAKMIYGTQEKKVSFQPMYSLVHSALPSLFIHRT